MPVGDRQRRMRRINIAGLAVIAILCLANIVALGFEVQRRLDVLARANTDNGRWALAQLEVEMLYLRDALVNDAPDLADVRKRFDILYSRVDTLEQSAAYEELRLMPSFSVPLQQIRDFLVQSVALVDADDASLALAVPGMAAEMPQLGSAARQVSLNGISFFAAQSDLQRGAVASTLRRVAALTAMLVIALSVLAILLLRLYRRSKQQAEENRLTTARLETVVDSSVDGIIVVDGAGRVLEFNPAAETMFGYSRDEAVGGEVTALFLPPDAVQSTIETIQHRLIAPEARTSGPQRIMVEVMRKDRTRFVSELSVATVEREEGAIYVAFLRDISDRLQAERDLTEARDRALEGEKAKSEFFAVMSHEMRTPLNGLLGSAEILGATPLEARQRAMLDVIETTGQVLLHHVNAVLDISSAEAGAVRLERVGFDLESLVHEAVANQTGLAAAAGNRISVVVVGDPAGRVTGDPGRLRQILLNLVGNAVKFTRDGEITVEVEPFSPVGPNRLVEVRVIDTGIGIAESELDRIFEDFVTLDTSYGRASGGTGLGLGITQRLVRALGGEIGVESEPGAGSVFWVRLPFGVDAAPATATGRQETAADAEARSASRSLSVLVVEDNPINRFVLRSLLEEDGHDVSEAEDGIDGVARAEAELHDVILMDISMPRLDGIEATRRIRAGSGRSRDARIFAITAHAGTGDPDRFREAGMSGCLLKPITRVALTAALAREAVALPIETDAPLVDPMITTDLFAHLGDETARALMDRFIDEGDALVAQLAVPISRESARMLCHKLAGSAATFGALRLGQELRRIELALEGESEPETLLARLAPLWSETRGQIARARTLEPSAP